MLLYSSLAILNLAIKHKYTSVQIPFSYKGFLLVKLLYNLGYLNSYNILFNKITINFKYYKNNIVLNGFKFYSRPSAIKSITYMQLRRAYLLKKKSYILLTNDGLKVSIDALLLKQGGLIIAEIK